jgi:hypothetical protein
MREGHVRQVDISVVLDDGLSRRSFDSQVVEHHPQELHCLDGQQQWKQWNVGKSPFQQKCGSSVIDRERKTPPSSHDSMSRTTPATPASRQILLNL